MSEEMQPTDPIPEANAVLVQADPEALLDELRRLEHAIISEEETLTAMTGAAQTQKRKVAELTMLLRQKLRSSNQVLPLFEAGQPPAPDVPQ